MCVTRSRWVEQYYESQQRAFHNASLVLISVLRTINFEWKYKSCFSRNSISKFRLKNDDPANSTQFQFVNDWLVRERDALLILGFLYKE